MTTEVTNKKQGRIRDNIRILTWTIPVLYNRNQKPVKELNKRNSETDICTLEETKKGEGKTIIAG